MTAKEKAIAEFNSFLEKVQLCNWRDTDSVLSKGMTDISEESFDQVFFDNNLLEDLFFKNGITYWQKNKVVWAFLVRYSHKADDLLKGASPSMVKELLIEKGLYSDVSLIDDVASSCDGDVQVIAAQYCSVSTLRTLIESKNEKVRKIVFQRLGPVECLDLMLKDKRASIREEGVRLAPVGYGKLNSMTKEIARGPFSQLISKISSEYLPMLLANRNLKNTWISKRLEERLSLEGKNDE